MEWVSFALALLCGITLASSEGVITIPQSSLTCFPECVGDNNTTCRAALKYNSTTDVVATCFPMCEIEKLYETSPDDSLICGSELAVLKPTAENLPEMMTCDTNSTDNKCPFPDSCRPIDLSVSTAGLCCSFGCQPESFRKKRAADDPHRKLKEKLKKLREKKKKLEKKKDDDDDEANLTTEAPEGKKKCERVTGTKEFPGKIVSVTISKQLGYHVCTDDDYEVKKKGKLFKVKGCVAIYKVCYITDDDVTEAPLTTETPEFKEKCITLENIHGLVKNCPSKITSVTYRPAKGNGDKKGKKGRGKSFFKFHKKECEEDEDYFVRDDTMFVANNRCPGTFKICHKKVRETSTALLTTTPSATEKCRDVIVLRRKKEKKFKGKITSYKLRQEFKKGYKKPVCERGVNYKAKDNVFTVKGGCHGVFEVCFEHRDNKKETTTAAALTTTEDLECEKIINVHGVKQHFPGEIRTASYIEVQQQKGAGFYNRYGCHDQLDFFFHNDFFFANTRCVGFFIICWKKIVTTEQQQLTTLHPEPECKKIAVHKDGKSTVPGRIQSVQVIKQIPIFGIHHGFKVCKEGENFYIKNNELIVKKCPGLFKVCYFPGKGTTTAPFTTTEEKKKKKKRKRGKHF